MGKQLQVLFQHALHVRLLEKPVASAGAPRNIRFRGFFYGCLLRSSFREDLDLQNPFLGLPGTVVELTSLRHGRGIIRRIQCSYPQFALVPGDQAVRSGENMYIRLPAYSVVGSLFPLFRH